MRGTALYGVIAAALVVAAAGVGATVSASLATSEVERNVTASVGPGATGARVLRAQVLLACARFSPGEIDGRYGDDLGIAIRGYQENHAMKPTGVIDAEMWKSLDAHTARLLVPYAITEADMKGPFVPIPKTAAEQAKMTWMGFESPEEGLGEKFHMSPALLAELNPGMKPLTAGEQITVVDVTRARRQRQSAGAVPGNDRWRTRPPADRHVEDYDRRSQSLV
jgi:peptidoglycan hydrolase-like protein with peptidoglycan-binding domain